MLELFLSLVGGQGALMGILAAAGALIATWLHGRSRGRNASAEKQRKSEQKAREVAREVEDEIDRRPASENRKELGQWSR